MRCQHGGSENSRVSPEGEAGIDRQVVRSFRFHTCLPLSVERGLSVSQNQEVAESFKMQMVHLGTVRAACVLRLRQRRMRAGYDCWVPSTRDRGQTGLNFGIVPRLALRD